MFISTVKPIYTGHSMEPVNVALNQQLPFIYRLKLYVLFINDKNEVPIINNDLLYKGAL